jgi:GNAT superfamily N-acetyltransferase
MTSLPADIRIRQALDADMRACRLLLPEAFTAESAPEAMVAIQAGSSEFLVGACAVSWCNAPKPEAEPGGFPALVHVVAGRRREGIGRALIEATARWCQEDTTGLRSWLPVPVDSEQARFLERVGFILHHRTLHFETDLAGFHQIVNGLRQRLERTGRLSEKARIVRLQDAAAWDVAALVAPEFAAPHATILRRLSPRETDAFDLQRSVALYVGEVLAGVLIFSWNDGDVGIEVITVAAEFRGGAANVLLLEAATRAAIEGGAERFRFYCDERTRDTLGLARRAGATPTRIEAEYRRALA